MQTENVSKRALSNKTGIPRKSILNWLNGKYYPPNGSKSGEICVTVSKDGYAGIDDIVPLTITKKAISAGSEKTLEMTTYNLNGSISYQIYYPEDKERYDTEYTYDCYNRLTRVKTKAVTGVEISQEDYVYNERGELQQKSYSVAVSQTYNYVYKNDSSRGIDYVSFGNYKFKPLTDVNDRNTGKEIYSGENKVAAEYITYRKVGDHATNMPATVWFGNGSKIKDNIKYKYDVCGNISEITENGNTVHRVVVKQNKAPPEKEKLYSIK